MRTIENLGGEDVFWHPTAKNLVFNNTINALYSHDVWTNEESLIYSFENHAFGDTGGEGGLSRDGRYYAVYLRDYDEINQLVIPRAFAVIDLLEKRQISFLPLPENLTDFDWISISPLGTYVVVDYATSLTGQFEGLEVYNRQLTHRLWQKPLGAGHSDLGVNSNGDEILVMATYDPDQNLPLLKKFNLRDGSETLLLTLPEPFDLHISCRNELRSDWCFISTFDGEGRLVDDPTSWLPFEDEVFALKLDGTQQVQRLAHHHSRRFSPATPDRDTSEYWSEPHATINRFATRVLFGSNWRQNVASVSSVDAYIIDFIQMLPPRLDFRFDSGLLLLFWSAPPSAFLLESTSNPANPASWTPALEEKIFEQNKTSVRIQLTGPERFFRLRH